MKKQLFPLALLAAGAAGCAWWPGSSEPQAAVSLGMQFGKAGGIYRLQAPNPAPDCIASAYTENGDPWSQDDAVATVDIVEGVDEIASFAKGGLDRVEFYATQTGTENWVRVATVLNNGDLDKPVTFYLPADSSYDIRWKALHPRDASASATEVLVQAQHEGDAYGSCTTTITTGRRGTVASETIAIYLADRCYQGRFGDKRVPVTVTKAVGATPSISHDFPQ